MRVSRVKTVLKVKSIKGQSRNEFYFVDAFCRANVLVEARKRNLISPQLFVKVDRHKPISQQQISEVYYAFNKVLFSLAKTVYPKIVPFLEWDKENVDMERRPRIHAKQAFKIKGFRMYKMKELRTPDGTHYAATAAKLTFQDKSAMVYFSQHALDRFMSEERNPGVMKEAENRNIMIVPHMLQQAVFDGVVEMHGFGPRLKMKQRGWFRLDWDNINGENIWVVKTFLTPDMKDEKKPIKFSAKELASRLRLG